MRTLLAKLATKYREAEDAYNDYLRKLRVAELAKRKHEVSRDELAELIKLIPKAAAEADCDVDQGEPIDIAKPDPIEAPPEVPQDGRETTTAADDPQEAPQESPAGGPISEADYDSTSVAKLAEFGLSDAMIEKLTDASLSTFGELERYLANGGRIVDLPKVGKAKAEKIEAAIASFKGACAQAWTATEPEPTAPPVTDPVVSLPSPVEPAAEAPQDPPRTHVIEPEVPPPAPAPIAPPAPPAAAPEPAAAFMPPLPDPNSDWQRWPIYSILHGPFPDPSYYDRAREAVAALSNSTGQRPALYNLKELADELWARGGIPDLTYDQMRSLRLALVELREKNSAFAVGVPLVVIDPTLNYQVYKLSFAGDANNANGYCIRSTSGPAVNAYIARQHPDFRGRVDIIQGEPTDGTRIITLETPRYEDRHPRMAGPSSAVA